MNISSSETDPPQVELAPATTLKEAAYHALSALLIRGELRAGQTLTLREASQLSGFGLGPARDAIFQLASEGALHVLPNRSAVVPLLSRVEFDEIYEVRCILEGFAAARAAFNISAVGIRSLRRHLEVVEDALDKQDIKCVLQSNRDFHFGIYSTSRSKSLVGMIERLWLRFGPTLTMLAGSERLDRKQFFRDSYDFHVQLLDALHRRDPEGARTAVVKTLTASRHLEYYSKSPATYDIVTYEKVETEMQNVSG